MEQSVFLRLKLIAWVESLSDSDITKLNVDSQKCPELDRCFVYCNEAECDYYQLLLLIRTPTESFQQTFVGWLNSLREGKLRDLLDKGSVCGEQSFCMHYCGAFNCSVKKLIGSLMEISRLAA